MAPSPPGAMTGWGSIVTAVDFLAMAIGILMLLLVLGVPPIAIGSVARARGRDVELWRILCVIVPVIPLLYLLSFPPVEEIEEDDLPGLP